MPQRCQFAFWLAVAGRKGGGGRALAFRGGSIATPLATGREVGGGNGHATVFGGAQRLHDGRVRESSRGRAAALSGWHF